MRINTRFAVAVHILALIALGDDPAPSEKMAVSVGCHPVAVRQVMSSLKKAGLIETRNGVPGGHLAKPAEAITLREIYRVVGKPEGASLFDIHSNPSAECPVGRSIKGALEAPLAHAQEAMENALADYSLADITADILEKYSTENKFEVII